MSSVRYDGENLTLEKLWQVAVEGKKVDISQRALRRVEAARRIVENAVKEGRIVYGVTTGFGKLSDVQISPEHSSALQINLLRSHACGIGEPVSEDVSRAIMALKLNNLLRGNSGVRREVVQQLQELLNRNIHPVIPRRGSVGASGDLAPLAHMALVLIGEGEAFVAGKRIPGNEALRQAGLEPLVLSAKEGLSLINGTQYMTALAALGTYRALKLARTADVVAAMTVDALKGTPVAFDPEIQEARNHEGQKQVARNLLNLMEESEIRKSHLECKKVQDSYALRCIPQVHGACRDAIGFVQTIVERELNAATDNPLVFPESGRILSGGNFHGAPVAMVCDFLAIALTDLASISERRIAMMMDSSFSELPDFLTPKPGLNSGLMIAQVAAAAVVSENKVLSHPASVDSIPTSANKEDHVSMGANAANKLWQVLDNVESVLAIEAICAAQSLDLRAPLQPGKGVALAHSLIRNKVPFLDNDRVLSVYVEKIREILNNLEFIQSMERGISLE